MESRFTPITETDRAILVALARYHYLTAAQASRLLYPRLTDENRYMQRRFKRLVDVDLVLRLRALPMPRYGQAPHVFTLAHKGRVFVQSQGVSVQPYFRPSEERQVAENNPIMQHRLAAVDVLVAADRLCRDFAVTCPRLLPERALRRHPVHVAIGHGARRVAVIPDGWFQLCVNGNPPLSIALELDRAQEDQALWREKIAGYIEWAPGPYRQVFATDNLTIAVVTTTGTRVNQLRVWTMRELAKRDALALSDLFLFTCASPVTVKPWDFFFGLHWLLPHQSQPVSLLDPPVTVVREVFVAPV
jgi:hypothetical protein